MELEVLKDIKFENKTAEDEVVDLVQSAVKMAAYELNAVPLENSELPPGLHSVLSSVRDGIQTDISFSDNVVRHQAAKQPIEKAAGRLTDTVARYLELYLNLSKSDGFYMSFRDFYLRGIKRRAYRFDSVSKTLADIEHPLRLVGGFVDPVNYFSIPCVKPEVMEKEAGRLLSNPMNFFVDAPTLKGSSLTMKQASAYIKAAGVFSAIIETKDRSFTVARLEDRLVVLDILDPEATGQDLGKHSGAALKIFGYFKKNRRAPVQLDQL